MNFAATEFDTSGQGPATPATDSFTGAAVRDLLRCPVAAQARDHITTEELLAVTRSTRDALYQWVVRGLLPRPRIDADASGRQFAAWVPEALERARLIVAGLNGGQTTEEIMDRINRRWPRH